MDNLQVPSNNNNNNNEGSMDTPLKRSLPDDESSETPTATTNDGSLSSSAKRRKRQVDSHEERQTTSEKDQGKEEGNTGMEEGKEGTPETAMDMSPEDEASNEDLEEQSSPKETEEQDPSQESTVEDKIDEAKETAVDEEEPVEEEKKDETEEPADDEEEPVEEEEEDVPTPDAAMDAKAAAEQDTPVKKTTASRKQKKSPRNTATAESPYAGVTPIRVINREGKPPEAGVIKKIYLENFMCHKKLSVSLCRNINFINGQNGSGKSAILAGLQIALGASARRTNRAGNLQQLVQRGNGSSSAKIRVTLLNGGDDGFRQDVYGNEITVERCISLGGGYNGFRLLDEKGKEKSRDKKQLVEMLDHLYVTLIELQ